MYFGANWKTLSSLRRRPSSEFFALWSDWQLYGPSSFTFRILHLGEEWRAPQTRLKRERELFEANQGKLYNQYPPENDRYTLQLQVDHQLFSSIKAASDRLGLSEAEVSRRLKNPDDRQFQLVGKTNSGQPLAIDGVIYPSIEEAARKLQRSRATIRRYVEDPRRTTWFRITQKREESNDYPERE